jgi:hypothetical protein
MVGRSFDRPFPLVLSVVKASIEGAVLSITTVEEIAVLLLAASTAVAWMVAESSEIEAVLNEAE